jgi:hypothetical protein
MAPNTGYPVSPFWLIGESVPGSTNNEFDPRPHLCGRCNLCKQLFHTACDQPVAKHSLQLVACPACVTKIRGDVRAARKNLQLFWVCRRCDKTYTSPVLAEQGVTWRGVRC